MSTPRTNVSRGTITIPPPRPVSDPRNPAAAEPARTTVLNSTTVIGNHLGIASALRQESAHYNWNRRSLYESKISDPGKHHRPHMFSRPGTRRGDPAGKRGLRGAG